MTTLVTERTADLLTIIGRVAAVIFKRRPRRVVIAGEKHCAAEIGGELLGRHGARVRLFDISDGKTSTSVHEAAARAAEAALQRNCDEAILCVPAASARDSLSAAQTLREKGLCATVVSLALSRMSRYVPGRRATLAGWPCVSLASRQAAGERYLKRAFDVVVGLLLLVAAVPLWAVVVPLLVITQGRPVLFRQKRVGRGGRAFRMFKFRTMRPRRTWPPRRELDALNTRSGPMFKAGDDPRVTVPGKWLRRLCIDETPQIINVLKGEMSLVGARPPLPAEVMDYEPWHHARFAGPMGITGLWQTSDRSQLRFDDVVLLDCCYNANKGILLDVRILAGTVWAVLSGRAAT